VWLLGQAAGSAGGLTNSGLRTTSLRAGLQEWIQQRVDVVLSLLDGDNDGKLEKREWVLAKELLGITGANDEEGVDIRRWRLQYLAEGKRPCVGERLRKR
jgi:hypothetical protein